MLHSIDLQYMTIFWNTFFLFRKQNSDRNSSQPDFRYTYIQYTNTIYFYKFFYRKISYSFIIKYLIKYVKISFKKFTSFLTIFGR